MKKNKIEKVFIAGIKTYRIRVELKNKSRDEIVLQSWSKKRCIDLYNNLDTFSYRSL